ncbi:MAG: hypothetical protein ACLP2F_12145 [Steroidobacteraceae bacterium]
MTRFDSVSGHYGSGQILIRSKNWTPEAVVKVLPRASNDLTEHDLPYTADIEILLLAKPP